MNMPDGPDIERLYDEHAQPLYAFLLNFTRDEADTRDLLQDVEKNSLNGFVPSELLTASAITAVLKLYGAFTTLFDIIHDISVHFQLQQNARLCVVKLPR
jgi:hypothetical protein